MLYLIFYLFIAHLLADFYLQNDRMVELKAFKAGLLIGIATHILHILIHAAVLSGVFYLWALTANVTVLSARQPVMVAIGIIVMSHFVVDIIKSAIHHDSATVDFWGFIVDQVIHICVLAWVAYAYLQPQLYIPRPPAPEPDKALYADIILLLAGLTFLLKPASIIVSKFLNMAMADTRRDRINMTKSHLGDVFYQNIKDRLIKLLTPDGVRTVAQIDKVLDETRLNNHLVAARLLQVDPGIDVSQNFPSNQAGKWIGYTERTMIFLFFLAGQYTGIAAVMALKTAFRFNDLKDDNDSHRSEYIMIGTFVSFFITIAIAAAVRHILTSHHFGLVSSTLLKNIL